MRQLPSGLIQRKRYMYPLVCVHPDRDHAVPPWPSYEWLSG
jgi:hypothetical protein